MIIENPQTRLRSRSFILTEQDLAEAIKDYVERKINDNAVATPEATQWKITFICGREMVRVERINAVSDVIVSNALEGGEKSW